ncbi:type II secretion system protein [Tardiphaga sp.]|uniref:type IV pilus modification PilV family protein n=1 Tax=Tardiphaga sp. TaxID=1926292 RepID=UPI002638EE3D|nr:type II secretion system protein [Tardiphaga sp.]MDB5617782.1 prepilin-type N-terminal cleavage/methylation protein [Tardiphaga sp.]
MSRKSCSDNAAGFTLIEVLVALAIVATVLSSIGMVIATSVKGTRQIDQRLALAGVAETLMAGLPARELLKPGRQSGETAGHRWRIDVTSMPRTDEAPAGRWTPLSITLRLQAPRGPALQVSTVRLARTAAE